VVAFAPIGFVPPRRFTKLPHPPFPHRKSKVGEGKAISSGPLAWRQRQRRTGVRVIQNTPGSIGYLQTRLSESGQDQSGGRQNKAGKFVPSQPKE